MSKNRTEQPNIASGKIDVLEKDEMNCQSLEHLLW